MRDCLIKHAIKWITKNIVIINAIEVNFPTLFHNFIFLPANNPHTFNLAYSLCLYYYTTIFWKSSYLFQLVPKVGLEPTWSLDRQILSLLRLPISPFRQWFVVRNVRLELTSLSTVASETTAFTDFANRAGAPSQNRTMNWSLRVTCYAI